MISILQWAKLLQCTLTKKSQQVFQGSVILITKKEEGLVQNSNLPGDIKLAPKQGNIVSFDVSPFAQTQQFCLKCFHKQFLTPQKSFLIALTEKTDRKKIRQRKFERPLLAVYEGFKF